MVGGREGGGGDARWTKWPGIVEGYTGCEMDVAGVGPSGLGGDNLRRIHEVKDCCIRRKVRGILGFGIGGDGALGAGGASVGRGVRVKPLKVQRG